RRYRIRTVAGQDDFASMAEVVRRRYSRILLEAHEANPDAAEFSQENPVEALHRLGHGDRVPLDNLPLTPQDPSTSLRSGRDDKNGGAPVRLMKRRGAPVEMTSISSR